jgi:hypothetical protein
MSNELGIHVSIDRSSKALNVAFSDVSFNHDLDISNYAPIVFGIHKSSNKTIDKGLDRLAAV